MKTILLVNQDDQLLATYKELLEQCEYRVEVAMDAETAVARFDDDIDILVTSFRLEGENGVELAKRIRKASPGTPVIIVTSYGDKPEMKRDEAREVVGELIRKIRFYVDDPDAPYIM